MERTTSKQTVVNVTSDGIIRNGGIRTLIVSMSIVFLDSCALGLLVPVIPLILLSMGAAPTQVTLHLVLFSLGTLLFAPILGRVGDKRGFILTIRSTIILSIVATLGLSFATTWPIFLIWRFVQGAGGAKEALLYAYPVSSAKKVSKVRTIAAVGASRLMGLFIGPIAGGLIANAFQESEYGFNLIIYISVGLFLASLIVSAAFVQTPDRGTSGNQIKVPPKRPYLLDVESINLQLVLPMLVNLAVGASMGIVMSVTVLTLKLIHLLDAGTIGITLGALTLVVAFSRVVVSPIILRTLSVQTVTIIFVFLAGICFFGTALASTSVSFIAFLLTAGFVIGTLDVAIGLYFEQSSTDSNKGSVFGLLSTTTAAGQIVSASISGLLFERVSHTSPFLLAATVLMIAATGSFIFKIWSNHRSLD